MTVRGQIRNTDYRKQIFDMSLIRYGNITPTDLDAMIEYKNTGFILIEAKYKLDFYQDKGQRLAHERLVDALWTAHKPSVLIFARHQVQLPNQVNLAHCLVTYYRYCGQWRKWTGWTVKQVVDSFINHLDRLIQARSV